jgi:phosphoglycolate phosphatase
LDPIRAIIFDYNGVLVDDVKLHEETYWQAAKDTGFPVSRETIRKYISYAPAEKRKLFFGDISNRNWKRVVELKKEYYFEYAQKNNLLFPDAESALLSLSDKYCLALLSNTTNEYFQQVFPRHLISVFKETLFVEDVETPKPSPEPLREIMSRLKIASTYCCYVGDSMLDVRMAKKAGINMFAVATGDHSVDELIAAGANKVFKCLSELKNWIQTVS